MDIMSYLFKPQLSFKMPHVISLSKTLLLYVQLSAIRKRLYSVAILTRLVLKETSCGFSHVQENQTKCPEKFGVSRNLTNLGWHSCIRYMSKTEHMVPYCLCCTKFRITC